MAAERATEKYANIDAAKFFERAVSSAQRVADVGNDEMAQIWEALGDAHERADAYDGARRAYARGAPAARRRPAWRRPACC